MVSALPSPEHMLRMIEDPDVPRDRLVATIKALWKISNALIDQVASLTVDLAEARAQERAKDVPCRAADGLAGPGWHSGTPATGEARKSADSAESVNVTIQGGRLVVRIRGAIVEAEPQDARLDVIRAGMP